MTACFCGTNLSYEDCCKRFHDGQLPPTAEHLMRSRYSAYVLQKADFLLTTWYKPTRPKQLDFSDEQSIVWQKLDIIQTKKGRIKEDKGTVEFKAYYSQYEKMHLIHEISRFKKIAGQWFYVDGLVN